MSAQPIDWNSIEGQSTPPQAGAAPPKAGAIDWESIEGQGPQKPRTKPGVWQGFKETFAPTQMGGQLWNEAKNAYRTVKSGTPEERANLGAKVLRAGNPLAGVTEPTVEDFEEGARTGRNPIAVHLGHEWEGIKELPKAAKEATGNETGARAAGQLLGTGANFLIPGLGEEAEEAQGENFLARAASRLKEPQGVTLGRRFVAGARATPEEIGEKASGGLISSATQRQNAITGALGREKQNIAPLYNNLHEADEAANPGGAIDLSRVTEDLPQGTLPKPKAGAKLTPKEMQDAGYAGKQAAKMVADGMDEGDVRSTLRNLGYSPNSVSKAMESLAEPGEEGGFTLAKARALRQQVGRAAMAASRAGRDSDARTLWGKYADITEAMRNRADELGGAHDFDLADARWTAVKDAERDLDSLTSARSGKRALADEFQKAWDKLTSNQRDQLQFLSKSAGLDVDALKKGAATADKVLAGTKNVPVNWRDRFVKGYIPARIAIAAALGAGGYAAGRKMPPGVRQILYMLPMLAGYGGVGFLKPIMARGAALEAMGELPSELPRAGFGRATPTELHPPPEPIPLPEEPPTPVPGGTRLLPGAPTRGRAVPPSSGRVIEIGPRKLTGMVQRPVRGLLASQNVREEGPGPVPITTGERLALPSAGSTPEHGIRTIGGRRVPPEWTREGELARQEEMNTPLAKVEQPQWSLVGEQRDNATRAQLATLDRQYNALNEKLRKAKSYDVKKKVMGQLKDLSAQRNELREKVNLPTQEIQEGGKLATYNSLSKEDRASIDIWAKEIPHLPQSLRESEMAELAKYRTGRGVIKGESLKELLARREVAERNRKIREPGEE